MTDPIFQQARGADPTALALALQASRHDTLATFAACELALADLRVPQQATLNPPLWELGHIGWFQHFWLTRNPQRHAGAAADADAPRRDGHTTGDRLYNSSQVPHASRWTLPLPDAAAAQAELAAQLDATLALLAQAPSDDDALYFFRLSLAHEDMHHEAALYMAQSLGVPIADARWQCPALPAPPAPLRLAAASVTLGEPGPGFAFDNELGPHRVELPPFEIDAQAVRWAEFLPFVEAGGYQDSRGWPPGAERPEAPRYLRREGSTWQQWRHGVWRELDLAEPACHLSALEAQAWCAWAGRRLPSEAEWQHAALTHPEAFRWGEVWEWTQDAFEPYPGFVAHPYRDYSAPWFGTRRVLRGGSFMTQGRMKHPRYRNFFQPGRSDVPAGFRSCSLQA